MNDKNKFELTEKFIDGDLDGNDLVNFEKELEINYNLQRELKLREEINAAIIEDDVINLRNKLESIEVSMKSSKKRRLVYFRKWHLTAASVILLIGIWSVVIFQK